MTQSYPINSAENPVEGLTYCYPSSATFSSDKVKMAKTLKSPVIVNTLEPCVTVNELLTNKAALHAEDENHPWMIDAITGRTYEFEDFVKMSQNGASWFHSHDMRKGDVLLYLTHNFSILPLVFTSVWRANGIVRSSHPENSEEDLLGKIIESRVKWIYCEPEDSHNALDAARKCSWNVHVLVNGTAAECTAIDEVFCYKGQELPDQEIDADEVAMILSTSGTTGRSRGVVRTHRSIIGFIQTHNMYPWEGKSLLQFKSTHMSGSLVPLANVAKGITTVAVWKLEREQLYKAVDMYKPQTVAAFPLLLVALVNVPEESCYDFSSINAVITGGAHVTQVQRRKLKELPSLKHILQVYGLSECAAVIANLTYGVGDSWEITDPPPGKNGRVAPGKDIQIRDPDTSEVFGPHEIGEICVKSPELFSYYLNNQQATEAAFTEDGYFKTRDLGFYDDDEYIAVVGRMEDVFRYKNKLVSLDHLDDVISNHPSVDEVCTVAATLEDEDAIVPRAFVTLKAGHAANPEEIIDFVRETVPDHMRLRGGLEIVPSLPRGATGKISRMLVRRMKQ